MNYLDRLREINARERESENFTQFAQSIQLPNSDSVITNNIIDVRQHREVSPTNSVLLHSDAVQFTDHKHERDFAQFLQLANNESVVQTAHHYQQVNSENVGEQTSLSFSATNDLSLVADDEPSDAIQDDLGFALPKLLPQQAPEANCTNCGKSSTDANESGNREESENINGSCRICRYVSRFGNCTVPITSGLSEKFMLISHPQTGVGCGKFQPSIAEKTAHVLHLIDRALRIKAIDKDEAERARDAVLRANSIDYQYVIEYESLIRACIRSTEIGERRDES